MKRLLFILIAFPFLFNSCQQNNPTPTGNNNTGSNNTGNNSSPTTYTWYFEVKVNGVVHRVEGSFDNTFQTNSGINTILYGPNTTYMVLNSGLLTGKLKAKGESTYVSGESFEFFLTNTNISLGQNDFVVMEQLNQLGVEGYGGWGTSTVNGFSAFSLSPVDTNTAIYSPTFPVNITQLPTATSFNSSTQLYDVGNPIIGSGSATIYTLDTITSSTFLYSYSRPYNVELNFKTYASPN